LSIGLHLLLDGGRSRRAEIDTGEIAIGGAIAFNLVLDVEIEPVLELLDVLVIEDLEVEQDIPAVRAPVPMDRVAIDASPSHRPLEDQDVVGSGDEFVCALIGGGNSESPTQLPDHRHPRDRPDDSGERIVVIAPVVERLEALLEQVDRVANAGQS